MQSETKSAENIEEPIENCPRCNSSYLTERYIQGDYAQVSCDDCGFEWEEECETIAQAELRKSESLGIFSPLPDRSLRELE